MWIAGKLRARYGTAVTTTYYDLFDPNCPPLPPDAQLPLVLVNGQILSSGGKLSMPSIRHHLDALGVQPDADRSLNQGSIRRCHSSGLWHVAGYAANGAGIRLLPDRIEVDLVLNCPGCPDGGARLFHFSTNFLPR